MSKKAKVHKSIRLDEDLVEYVDKLFPNTTSFSEKIRRIIVQHQRDKIREVNINITTDEELAGEIAAEAEEVAPKSSE